MEALSGQIAIPFAGLTDFILDPIVDVATDVIDALGLAGVFVLMLLESACIPVPSEAIMLFAGFNVSEGDMTLFGIVAAGVLGNVVGSWIAYAVGYYGRLELLERNRLIHVNRKHLDWADSLVPAPRRRDRLLHPDAADHPHLHLASGRGRADAVLALHRLHARRLRPLGADARHHRPRGRRPLGGVARLPALRRLPGPGGDRRGADLPADPPQTRRRRAGPRGAPLNPGEGLTPARAAALGAVQGPAELLPVSSSAHLSLLPWLAGWEVDRLDPEPRKSFEVALHAGTAAALLIGQRRLIAAELAAFDRRRAAVVALSFVPPAIGGYVLERQIERRLGGPGSTAAGLVAGALAMVLADRRPQVRGPGDAGPVDGLALGLAQAAALIPGVSRNGATLTAARARRFDREQANLLSRTVALPVIVGATLLKGVRLRRRGVPLGFGRAIGAGVGASFVSTLASQRLIALVERDRALWPYAAYRIALAAAIAVRMAR